MKLSASALAISAVLAVQGAAAGQLMPQYILSRLVPEDDAGLLAPRHQFANGQLQTHWLTPSPAAHHDPAAFSCVFDHFGAPAVPWFYSVDANPVYSNSYTDLKSSEDAMVVPLASPAWLGGGGLLLLATRRRRSYS